MHRFGAFLSVFVPYFLLPVFGKDKRNTFAVLSEEIIIKTDALL